MFLLYVLGMNLGFAVTQTIAKIQEVAFNSEQECFTFNQTKN